MLRRLRLLFVFLAALRGSMFAAPEQWIEVRSDHFTVITDSNEKQARHILDQFERMRWMFQTLFPQANPDPAAPIVVIAAKNEKTFDAMEPEAYLARGQLKLGGYFMQAADKNYILLRLDAEEEHPFAAVYHEYTHLQFSSMSEFMPLWLNEGLAEFFQNTEIRNKDVVIGEASPEDILYLRQNRTIPLPVLFKVDAKSPYYHEEQKGSVFYAESWALTHYLFTTDKKMHTSHVTDYLNRMSHHEDPVAAAEKTFGDLNKLQTNLEAYIGHSAYMDFILSSAAAPIDESAYKVSALTETQSDAARADVLAYVQRTKESHALLNEVLKSDPNNAQAHETMGFLEMQQGHMDEARKWYEAAVKLDSQSYLAHYYFAAMSMRQGTGVKDEEIESSLRTAIRLNPRFAPSYNELADFYGMRHKSLDEAAKLAIQAIKLDPGSLSVRMNSASVFMNLGRYDDAAVIMRSAIKLAKSPDEVAMVQSRLVQLDQFKAGAQANMSVNGRGVPAGQAIVMNNPGPKHPTEPANGPKHEALGVIRGVKCSYPSVIEFKVEAADKTVSLYSNDYYKLEFSALGFQPSDELHPCDDIEGVKARVQYAESSDKSVDGQAISVELRK
jgi:tetratricopeptide (TPR) repeat protein